MNTKTGVGPALGLAVVIAIGIFVVAKVSPTSRDDRDGVIAVVTFTPESRTGGAVRPGGSLRDWVSIWVEINQVHVEPERVTKSPWSRVLSVKKGDSIVVRADQFVGDSISCALTRNGVTLAKPNTKSNRFEVQCSLVVT